MLLDRDLNVKLFDFGLSKLDEKEQSHLRLSYFLVEENDATYLRMRSSSIFRELSQSLLRSLPTTSEWKSNTSTSGGRTSTSGGCAKRLVL